MQIFMFNTPSLQVMSNTGSEGPSYDPYSYRELSVTFRGTHVVLHDGSLVNWIEVDGTRHDIHDEACRNEFEAILGFTPENLDRWYYRKISRCPCGSKSFHDVAGYPGESFIICDSCGKVRASSFNESAII